MNLFVNSITGPSTINREMKNETKQAMEKANTSVRAWSTTRNTQQHQDKTNNIKDAITSTTNVPDYRWYCAVCGVSSLTNFNATFSTLPIVNVPPKNAATNRQRRTYYAQRCRRRLHFKRLNPSQEQRKCKYVYICNKHEQQDELTTF
jgi:hypothetical protein